MLKKLKTIDVLNIRGSLGEIALPGELPKWPQCLITSVHGEPFSEERTKDIIFRTDSMFTQPGDYHGNNRRWVDWANKTLGYDQIFALGDWQKQYKIRDALQEEFDFVYTNYIHNTWASSSFIFGPYGWCKPNGEICYFDNIGKWPTVEEVANDLADIGKAFPYVSMYATLMSGEQCEAEEGTKPLLTMKLENGEIDFYEGSMFPYIHMKQTRRVDADYKASVTSFASSGREQGLPDEWIQEFGEKTRPVVEKAISGLK